MKTYTLSLGGKTWVVRLSETQQPETQFPKAFALFLIMPQQEDNIHWVSLLSQSEQIPYEGRCLLAPISCVIISLPPEDRQDQLQPSHLTMHHPHCLPSSFDRTVQYSIKWEASPSLQSATLSTASLQAKFEPPCFSNTYLLRSQYEI